MTFTPTLEQQAIVAAAKTTKDNLMVSALAGAAKTSTLVLLANALSGNTILCLAFNKKIAEEMKERLPPWCESLTLNGLGHRVWKNVIGKFVRVDTDKGANILREFSKSLPKEDNAEFYEAWGDILKTFRLAKSRGYIPPKAQGSSHSLCSREEFIDSFDGDLPDFIFPVIDSMLKTSIAQAFDGIIDFDDQIYMPTLFGGNFPSYKIVMIDEAQDLSPLNHALLRKLCRNSRVIAVGDPNQAIYGFRGAMSGSMAEMREHFNMTMFPLTVSFRCPISVVENVHWLVPEMRYPEWAKPGSVSTLNSWTTDDIEDGSAVICRTNAPLFWLAFTLLKHRRSCKLVGVDIGPQLVKVLKKLGPPDLPRAEVHEAIEAWAKEQSVKVKRKGTLKDKAECLHIFADQGRHLSEIILIAEDIFRRPAGQIQLMSGHKSKGLEFNTVYHLDAHRCRIDLQHEDPDSQEANIRYVIDTRAKERLIYITRDGLTQGA